MANQNKRNPKPQPKARAKPAGQQKPTANSTQNTQQSKMDLKTEMKQHPERFRKATKNGQTVVIRKSSGKVVATGKKQ